MNRPDLSIIVAVGAPVTMEPMRDQLRRLVETLGQQARRHGWRAELLLVDWRAGDGRPDLGSLLSGGQPSGSTLRVRVVEVPPALAPATAEPGRFRERLAQNVGIRRAAGRDVLVLSMEVLLSDPLAALIAGGAPPDRIALPDRWYVAADRRPPAGSPPPDPGAGPEELLDWCAGAVRFILTSEHARLSVGDDPDMLRQGWTVESLVEAARALVPAPVSVPLSGASGFLYARRGLLETVRGFPEWDMADLNLDWFVFLMAERLGIPTERLPPELFCFHLYGLRPRLGSMPLPVRRLRDGRPLLSHDSFALLHPALEQVRSLKAELAALPPDAPVLCNDESWGMVARDLPVYDLVRPAEG